MLERRYKKKDDIVCRKIAGEIILVPITGTLADMQRLFVLNEVGEYVWERLDGSRSVTEIGEAVADAFDADYPEVLGDLMDFLQDLAHSRLITGDE